MKKLFFIFLFISIPYAYAVDYFFSERVGVWDIIGHPGDTEKKLNPACIARTSWQDGSYLLLIQDLKDGELLMEFQNLEWDISSDFDKQYPFKINVYSGDKSSARSWDAYFILSNKNTISIRGLDYKEFLPAFMNYSSMKFIMPGNIPNAVVSLENTTKAIGIMTDCLKVAEKGIPQVSSKGSLNSKMDL